MIRTEYDDIKVNLIKKSLEKDKSDVYVPVERRKGNDTRLKFINLMCFLLWSVLFMIMAVIEKAGKSIVNITQNDLLWKDLSFWESNLLGLALSITIGCIIVCSICIILNLTRYKRRSDRIRKSLILCEIIFFIIGIFLSFKLF